MAPIGGRWSSSGSDAEGTTDDDDDDAANSTDGKWAMAKVRGGRGR